MIEQCQINHEYRNTLMLNPIIYTDSMYNLLRIKHKCDSLFTVDWTLINQWQLHNYGQMSLIIVNVDFIICVSSIDRYIFE